MRPWLRCLWGKIINREAAPTRLQNPTHNTAAKNQITVSPVTGIHFNASNKITVVSSRERKKISLIRVFFLKNSSMACVYIPVQNSEEEVRVSLDQLPRDATDILDILKAEQAPLDLWLVIAVRSLSLSSYQIFMDLER